MLLYCIALSSSRENQRSTQEVAPAPAPVDFNATPVAGGSSSHGARKHARKTPAGVLPEARNLFNGMSSIVDEDYV